MPKCTKISLAAGLRPDPLGSLNAAPYPLAAIKEVLLLRGGREGKERGRRRRDGASFENGPLWVFRQIVCLRSVSEIGYVFVPVAH